MALLTCNSCGETDDNCICTNELKDYDYDIYAGGYCEYGDY